MDHTLSSLAGSSPTSTSSSPLRSPTPGIHSRLWRLSPFQIRDDVLEDSAREESAEHLRTAQEHRSIAQEQRCAAQQHFRSPRQTPPSRGMGREVSHLSPWDSFSQDSTANHSVMRAGNLAESGSGRG